MKMFKISLCINLSLTFLNENSKDRLRRGVKVGACRLQGCFERIGPADIQLPAVHFVAATDVQRIKISPSKQTLDACPLGTGKMAFTRPVWSST